MVNIKAVENQINQTTFVREQDDEYGPLWKVVESYAWNEFHEDADQYGTVGYSDGSGCLTFKPAIVCDYSLFVDVLQNIVTFMNTVDASEDSETITKGQPGTTSTLLNE